MNVARFFMLFLVIMAISACNTSTQRTPEQIQARLKERAQQYWQFRKDRQLDKCYGLERPTYRATYPIGDYLDAFSGKTHWLEVEILKTQIQGTEGTVIMHIRRRVDTPFFPKKGIEEIMSEQWEYVDNDWYHVPRTLRRRRSAGD